MQAAIPHLAAIFVTLGLAVTTADAEPANTRADLRRRIVEVKRRLDQYAVKPTVNGRVKGGKVRQGEVVLREVRSLPGHTSRPERVPAARRHKVAQQLL